MPAKAFGQKRQMSPRERSELFTSRRAKQQRLAWYDLDYVTLITALGCCMGEGATISFAPAQGGIGVTLRIYRGDYADTEFAGSVEELDELLSLVIDGLASGAEDPREVTRLALNNRGTLAAD
jgi:hypothetical protein